MQLRYTFNFLCHAGIEHEDANIFSASHPHQSRLVLHLLLSHLISLPLIQCKQHNSGGRVVKGLKTIPWHGVQTGGLTLRNHLLWSWDLVVIAALICAG